MTEDIFDSIDLSNNDILKIENFPTLERLKTLLLSNNKIVKIAPGIGKSLPNLRSLILTNNNISSATELLNLQDISSLTHLYLLNNPITKTAANYRVIVAAVLPKLITLDGARITDVERKAAKQIELKLKQGEDINSLIVSVAAVKVPTVATKLTAADKAKLIELIDKATSLEQIDKLEAILLSGELPAGFVL